MTADPAILKRIRGCPFAGGGRVLVRFRANGYSLFARRSGEPLARLRLTGNSDEVVLLYPSHRGGWGALGDFGASAMPLDEALQCLSDNPYFLDLHETTVEPLQRIDAKQERGSLETTERWYHGGKGKRSVLRISRPRLRIPASVDHLASFWLKTIFPL